MSGNEESDQVPDLIPEPGNTLQEDQIKDIARNAVETLQGSARSMQENSAAMARWILASLLAINSGGAVAVLSASDQVAGPVGPSVLSFGIGAALAIMTGINGLVTGIRVGPIMGEAIELLRLSIFEGFIAGFVRQKIQSVGPILRRQMIISAALAASSLVAFTTGIVLAIL